MISVSNHLNEKRMPMDDVSSEFLVVDALVFFLW